MPIWAGRPWGDGVCGVPGMLELHILQWNDLVYLVM
jgi:hypothetical protein